MYNAHLQANIEWQFAISRVSSCCDIDVSGVSAGIYVLDEHLVVIGRLEWNLHQTNCSTKVRRLFHYR